MSAAFTIRAPSMQEVEAAARFLNEHSRRLHGVDDQPASELRQYWESPDVDFDRDVLVAEGSDGSLVGYADLGVQGDHVWLDVRGLEPEPLRALFDAIRTRAAEKKPGADLMGFTSEADRLVRDLYEQAGFAIARHSYRMEISLAGELPEPQWPDEFSVRTFREGEEERVYEAHMNSFADTWSFHRQACGLAAFWRSQAESTSST